MCFYQTQEETALVVPVLLHVFLEENQKGESDRRGCEKNGNKRLQEPARAQAGHHNTD